MMNERATVSAFAIFATSLFQSLFYVVLIILLAKCIGFLLFLFPQLLLVRKLFPTYILMCYIPKPK